MKKPQLIALSVAVAVFTLLAWNFLLYSPKKAALAKSTTILDGERKKGQDLTATLKRRQDLKKIEPKLDIRTAQLGTLVPDNANLGQFIIDATGVAKQAGVDFLSLSPALPRAGGAGEGEIAISMQVKSGFFQLLDYLVRIERLPRAVVIDALTVAPDTADGSVKLSVSITGRMFTSTVPQHLSLPAGAGAPTAPGLTATVSGYTGGVTATASAATSVPAGATSAPAPRP